MRLYLDASPIIYWVEKVPAYHPKVDLRIKQAGVTLVSSHLALTECLVLPLRLGQTGLIQDYDQLFGSPLIEIVSFTEAVFRKAAEIRASHHFRTPDSLHLAAALAGACDVFLTNDAALQGFPGVAVEVVS
jgi:predicted nucleic acid-binding protein